MAEYIQFIVIAHTADEDWAYGPFKTFAEAQAYAEAQSYKPPLGLIEYQACELLTPNHGEKHDYRRR